MSRTLNDYFLQLGKALDSLESILRKPMEADRSNIDASIQRFEYSIELYWKVLRKTLESRGLEVVYPKDVLRAAFAGKLIDDETAWLQMLKDGNQTSHAYDEELANRIFENIKRYCPIMRKTYTALKQQFASARTPEKD